MSNTTNISSELNAALSALQRRRAELPINPPSTTINQVASRLAKNGGQTQDDLLHQYYHNLANNLPVNTQTEIISGSRERWDQLNKTYHPAIANAVAIIRQWYQSRMPHGGALILTGGCGCGKTALARAIAELQGPNALMLEEEKLIKTIQRSYNNPADGEGEWGIYQRAARAKLLVYDDLGTHKTDSINWIQAIYRNLINPRLDPPQAYIITTNLSLYSNGTTASEFEAWVGGRNYSRIMGSLQHPQYVIDLSGVPDYRMRQLRSHE